MKKVMMTIIMVGTASGAMAGGAGDIHNWRMQEGVSAASPMMGMESLSFNNMYSGSDDIYAEGTSMSDIQPAAGNRSRRGSKTGMMIMQASHDPFAS